MKPHPQEGIKPVGEARYSEEDWERYSEGFLVQLQCWRAQASRKFGLGKTKSSQRRVVTFSGLKFGHPPAPKWKERQEGQGRFPKPISLWSRGTAGLVMPLKGQCYSWL